MRRVPCPHFDLQKTLQSGQVFHWFQSNEIFTGLIGRELVSVRQQGEELEILRGDPAVIANYFSLDHPLEEICKTFPADPSLGAATEFCEGLRIMRQDSWECLATFITSALKQVPHIRQISLDLRQRFGEPIADNFWAYPSAEALAKAGETSLRESRLGFRAKSLAATSQMIADGKIDLANFGSLSTQELHEQLCRLPGVGDKVAHCVLLFAYERLEAFPIDVWIERVLRERYFAKKRNINPQRLRDFSSAYFGPYAGYAQQYLFHHARLTMGRRVKK